MGKKKGPQFYAVAQGRKVGIYSSWPQCEAQVKGFSKAKYKSFNDLPAAEEYLRTNSDVKYTCTPAKDNNNRRKDGEGDQNGATEGIAEVTDNLTDGPSKELPWWERPSPELEEGSEKRKKRSLDTIIASADRSIAKKPRNQDTAKSSSCRPDITLEDGRRGNGTAASPFIISESDAFPAKEGYNLRGTSSTLALHANKIVAGSKRDRIDTLAKAVLADTSKELVLREDQRVRIIEAYTDGAASDNGKLLGSAGWGVYWPESDDPKSDLYGKNESEKLPGELQTNNRAELMGIIRAVQLCPDADAQLIIYTDSQYCINAINLWQRNWRRQNWRTSKDEPVLNKDLIRLLERELRNRKLRPTLVKVKGHSSNKGNRKADQLAVKGAKKPMIAPHLWRNLEPSDSEDETDSQILQKAISYWERCGYSKEDATKRAGGGSSERDSAKKSS
ncbi:hypothetical protein CBS101457_005782 [Exobasidium rhododendri]|nr:hypothetical protein CBS101457_005782 [Exobasidium rhododendri]